MRTQNNQSLAVLLRLVFLYVDRPSNQSEIGLPL